MLYFFLKLQHLIIESTNWSILSNMLSFFVGLIYIHVNTNNNCFFLFGRILTIISSNDNALKVLSEVMGNLEDGGSVSI